MKFWKHYPLIVIASFSLSSFLIVERDVASGDEDEVYIQFRALYERGELFLDAYEDRLPENRRLRGTHGHIYSKYGLVYPSLCAGLMKIVNTLTAGRFNDQRFLFKWLNCFLFLLSSWFIYDLARRLGASEWYRWALTIGYAGSTFAIYAATWWSSNVWVASVLLTAFFLFFRATELEKEARDAKIETRSLAMAGMFIGIAGLCRSLPFLIAPLMLGILWLRSKDLVTCIKFCIPVALCTLVYITINYIKLGGFGSTYHSEGFSTPFHAGFLGSLLWPGKSFILLAPVSLLGAYAAASMLRSRRDLALLICSVVTMYTVAYSKWWAWWSGPDIGQRFWIPMISFLVVALSSQRSSLIQGLAVGLISFGLYVQGSILGVHPRDLYAKIYDAFPYKEENIVEDLPGALPEVLHATFVETRLLAKANHIRQARN